MNTPDVSEEFQRSRNELFNIVKNSKLVWLSLLSFLFIAIALSLELGANEVYFVIAFFLFFTPGVVKVSYLVPKLYRCPICRTIPTGGSGIILNPSKCQKCGAILEDPSVKEFTEKHPILFILIFIISLTCFLLYAIQQIP